MQYQIKAIEEKYAVGTRGSFFCGGPKVNIGETIPPLWRKFYSLRSQISASCSVVDEKVTQSIITRPTLLSSDDGKAEEVDPNERILVASIFVRELPAPDKVPDGCVAVTVPSGKYAVFTHKGLPEGIMGFMKALFAWLPSSGLHLRDAPQLETYDERWKMGSEDSETDVWIPIQADE